MNLYVQQHVFSITQQTEVYNENEEVVYELSAEVFSLGRKMHVYDGKTQKEVGYLDQQIFHLMSQYKLYGPNGEFIGTLEKKFNFLNPAYDLDSLGWKVDGGVFGHEYEITCDNNVIATINKEWMSFGDCYNLQFSNYNDAIVVLLIAMAIDADLDHQSHVTVHLGHSSR